MDDGWRAETGRVTRSFDVIGDLYRQKYTDELDHKPFDRELLAGLAGTLRGEGSGAPVLEVGAGPGQVSAFLRARGVRVVASDASHGQTVGARVLDPGRPALVADLARVPVRPGGLAAIVAFYCLIYGSAAHLDAVFAEWRRVLIPGGRAVLAVHEGDGTIHVDDWQGRRVDITVVLRDPDDLVRRLERQGFGIEQQVTRPPYTEEHPTDRLYVVAVAPARAGRRGA